MTTARIDLHAKVISPSVVSRAKSRGLDGIVYAPHFTRLPAIRERAERFSEDGFAVISAREVFTGSWRNRKHVLALDLDEPVPDFITLEAAMEEFSRQDATVLVPHPEFATVSLSSADVRTYSDLIRAVETYNPKHLPSHNRRAGTISERLGMPAFTSSYAHLSGTVGEAWTAFPDLEPDQDAVIEALDAGAPRSIEHRQGIGHRVRCTAEISHLLWENTWEKFERVVLSGREATHPRHPAYEGRFDDVAVY